MAGRSQLSDPEKLKDAFRRAAEIAAVVPASMQEAAFHRALDQILGDGEEPTARRPAGRRPPRDGVSTSVDTHSVQQLIDRINRTAYPEIASATKVLDRALAVLRLAKRDFDIDGLTAPEIAKVLTDKFRQRTSRQAVTQALGAAHTMVDTRTRGRTTAYRIMQEGEDYLDRGGDQDQAGETGKVAPTRRRRLGRGRRVKAAAKASTDTEATTRPARRRGQKRTTTRTTRRRGPKTMLSELIDEGFFSQARTINDAQEQLRHKKGVQFSLQELSPAFVRLLRDRRLDRDRNASGQYEYRAK
jgi:hypothetical protein